MKKIYHIKLKLKTAVHINAGVGSDGRRIVVKSNGEKYIPATLIKGILRNQMEMIVKTLYSDYRCNGKENAQKSCDCIMCRMFGKAGFQPSRIIIDNLYSEKEIKMEIRTNNAINRFTRKANDGALVSQEVAAATKESVFEGDMTVYYKNDAELKYEKILLKSFEMIDSIGSSKSRGLGLVEIEVSEIA